MKKILLIVMSMLCTAMCAQSPLDVRVLTLPNGFTVWLNEDHSQPKVYGAVVVRVGAKDCPNTGMAHYFEHLLFKGTDSIGTVNYASEKPWLDSISAQYDLLARTKDEVVSNRIRHHINELSVKAAEYAIPNEFENLITTYGGSGLNAYTSFDETVYHNTFSPQYMAQWCKLNADRLISPVFRLFQGELETVYEEKNMYQDQMLTQAAEAAQCYALDGTPYAYPIIGSTENLKKPQLSALQKFYREYYVAGNMGLMLCGDFIADSVIPILNRTFGRIRAGVAPQSHPSRLRDFRGTPALKIKLPIPVVKASGYAFKAPMEGDDDYIPFKVMTNMLSNDSETGLLDSLANTNRVMMAGGDGYNFRDFSVYGFGSVPNIPFGSKRKAEKFCFEQVDRLRAGQFSDAMLEAVKLMERRRMEMLLENPVSRSNLMVNAFSHGQKWSDVLSRSSRVEAVTHDDVMRMARRYFNDDSLRVVKVFGRYPKDHVSQPGYMPVKPGHAGEKSEYARAMAKMPYTPQQPKLVDFDHDAEHSQLAPLVNLYVVKNPVNDIASVELIYRCGSDDQARIDVLADYLNSIGTEEHNKQQLGRALQRLGASLGVSSSAGALVVTLSSFDKTLSEAMALLHEFLTKAKPDDRKYRDLIKSTQLEEKSLMKQNNQIADAVYAMVADGEESSYLRRLSARDLKQKDAQQMIGWFEEMQHSQMDIVYSGGKSLTEISDCVRRFVPTGKVDRAWKKTTRKYREVSQPTVYVYDNPRARQTVLGTYQNVGVLPTVHDRAVFRLWGSYFGSGMSSVLFQEIREFRAMAYSAYGAMRLFDLRAYPDNSCGYVTRIGTQGDKTMLALGVLDSIMTDMPLREANVAAAKQEIINAINNGYPSFRALGKYIAGARMLGYSEDMDRPHIAELRSLGTNDMLHFYHSRVQPGPRAIVIVGSKKHLDMNKLRTMGKVVELKFSDIYRR